MRNSGLLAVFVLSAAVLFCIPNLLDIYSTAVYNTHASITETLLAIGVYVVGLITVIIVDKVRDNKAEKAKKLEEDNNERRSNM